MDRGAVTEEMLDRWYGKEVIVTDPEETEEDGTLVEMPGHEYPEQNEDFTPEGVTGIMRILDSGIDASRFVRSLISTLDTLEGPKKSEAYIKIFDKLIDEYGDKIPAEWMGDYFVLKDMSKSEYVVVTEFVGFYREFLDSLVDTGRDKNVDKEIGFLIKMRGVPDLANTLRYRLIRGNFDSEEQKAGYEDILRGILAYPEIEEYYRKIDVLGPEEKLPLPMRLEDVYANTDFSSYPVSEETRKFRMKNLNDIFTKIGITDGSKICDIGCGTGWLVDDLLAFGYKNVTGVDSDPTQLATARNLFPMANFIEADMEQRGLHLFFGKKEVYQDAVLMLGRTSTHAEDWETLDIFFENIYDALKFPGYLIMDWPDVDAKGGVYEEYRDCVKKMYKRYGFSDEELDAVIVQIDGPASRGEHPLYPLYLYNRLVPSLDEIKKRLGGYGFDLVETIEEDLPNGTGKDKNVVMILKKKNFPDSKVGGYWEERVKKGRGKQWWGF